MGIYPWDEWFRSLKRKTGSFTVYKGVDFNCKPHGMAQQIRNWGKKRSLLISIAVCDGPTRLEVRWRKKSSG